MSQRLKTAANVQSDRIGFFGKAPTHGDFVGSDVGASLQEALDQWIRTGMQASEQAFGRRWRELFHATAPWRFVVQAGLWGPTTIAGVLLPSTDRVGRSFPFVIMAQLAHYAGDPRWLYYDKTWFIAAEALAETSRARDFDFAGLLAGIKRLRPPHPRTPAGDEIEQPRHDTAGGLVSIWWTIDADTGKPHGFQTSGAPDAADFVKLLEGASPTPAAPETRAEAVPPSPEPIVQEPVAVPAPIPAKLVVERGYATHAGTRHSVNSDALLVSETPRLFVVADGIGEGAMAADAAKLTINTLAGTPGCETLAALVQEVKGKFGRAQGVLQSASMLDGRGEGPKVSAAALAILDDAFAVVWAGDVRCYIVRDGMMRPLTRDHVEIGLHRRLSRSIGGPGQLVPEIVADRLHDGDRLLLCSAPLLRALDERVIAETLLANSPSAAAAALIEEALIANSRDNVSAIVIGAGRG